MHWQLIESDEAMLTALQAARGAPAVAVDTEFMRRNTFYPQVALLQLCFDDTAYLVDPLRIDDTTPLCDLLIDPSVLKVLHSASEDLEVFQRWLGETPRPLFDTQRAAAFVDVGFGLGYRKLVLDLCDVDLAKGETRSDWLQRPLTESQCEYAAQDVAWLLPIWARLEEQCREQGKLDWVLSDGEDACRALATNTGDYYRRIKNAWKLDQRSLGKLIAISDWREQQARKRDKPRGWIIDDKACVQLAQARVGNKQQLAEAVEIHQGALRRYGDELMRLLEQQELTSPGELPTCLPSPLRPEQRQQVKALKSYVRDLAEEMQSAPEVLLQSKDFELLVREAGGESVTEPGHWRGWRAQQVVDPCRRYLAENSR
jgi:ribonuclease D